MPNLIVRHRLRIRNRTTNQWEDIPAIISHGGTSGGSVSVSYDSDTGDLTIASTGSGSSVEYDDATGNLQIG